MEMNLMLPVNYVEVDKNEMEYIDGAGTITLTLTSPTIKKVIGGITGAVTTAAVTAGLNALGASIATSIELGTAGLGTLFAGAFVLAWRGITPKIASMAMGYVAGKTYTGGSKTVSFSVPYINSRSYTF